MARRRLSQVSWPNKAFRQSCRRYAASAKNESKQLLRRVKSWDNHKHLLCPMLLLPEGLFHHPQVVAKSHHLQVVAVSHHRQVVVMYRHLRVVAMYRHLRVVAPYRPHLQEVKFLPRQDGALFLHHRRRNCPKWRR